MEQIIPAKRKQLANNFTENNSFFSGGAF